MWNTGTVTPTPKRILIWNCDLDLARGKAEVDKLEALNGAGEYDFVSLPSMNYNEIQSITKAIDPEIFHFIGHGEPDGTLHVRGSDTQIPAAEIINQIQTSGKNLKGVYLSGCFSIVDTPRLLKQLPPAGGWLIGTGVSVDDEQAEFFAERFYKHLVEDKMAEEEAYDNAYLHVASIWTFDDMTHRGWFYQSPLPRIDDMVKQVHTTIRAIFMRSALQFSMRNESSIIALEAALDDVALALSTGKVRDRRTNGWFEHLEIPPEYLQGPEIEQFTIIARQKLQACRDALELVKAGAQSDRPVGLGLNDFAFNLDMATKREWMRRINKVDQTRNDFLREADRLFARTSVPRLPKIRLSYSKQELASARAAV